MNPNGRGGDTTYHILWAAALVAKAALVVKAALVIRAVWFARFV